jgi:hypothetical protein
MSSAHERRSEARHAASGPLKLSFEDPSPQEVDGRLLDYSISGFRAEHPYAALHTGQEVEFKHSVAMGRARVMWNRIADDRVETGFLVIK